MNRTPVTSSNVASVGYDSELKVLEVEFKNESIYQYTDVSQEKFDSMLHAESVGKYLNTEIKGAHEFVKIKDAKPVEKVAKPKKVKGAVPGNEFEVMVESNSGLSEKSPSGE